MDNRVKTPQDLAFDHGGVVGMTYPNQSISQTPEQAAATATFTQAIMAAAAWKRAQASNPQPGMMSANPAPPTTYGTNPASAPNSRTVRPGGSGVFMAPTPAQLEARRSAAVAAHEQRYAGQNPAQMTPAQQREYMRSAENARNQQKYRDLANPQAVDFNGQQLPHGSVVGSKGGTLISTPNGMAAQGRNGEALQFIEDPNTTGIVPTSVGMSPEEYDSALTDDQKTLVDEALTSIPGAVGKTFETLVQRRDAILGAANLTEQQRQQELAKVEGEISRARHSALSNPASVRAVKSGLDEVRRKKDEETSKTNEGIEAAAKKLREDERAEFERKVAEEIARTQNPYDKRTPEQIRNDAEKAILGGGASDPRKADPAKPIDLPAGISGAAFDVASDGKVSLWVPSLNGWVPAEVLPDGSVAVRPTNAREEEMLPNGVKYIETETKVDPKTGEVSRVDKVKVKTGSKAPEHPKPPKESWRELNEAWTLAARESRDKRRSEIEAYKKAHAQWQIKKATDEKNDRDKDTDPALWLQANPEPQPPKSMETGWTDEDYAAGKAARAALHRGLTEQEMANAIIADTNSRMSFRLIGGKKVAVVDGVPIPTMTTHAGTVLCVPQNGSELKTLFNNDVPIETQGKSSMSLRFSVHHWVKNPSDENAVAAWLKTTFPNISSKDIVETAKYIAQNAGELLKPGKQP